MQERPTFRKIGLLAHVGRGNLGDEATLATVIKNLKSLLPHADLVAFTMDPVDTQRRHRIVAYPLRRVRARSRAGNQDSQSAESQPVNLPVRHSAVGSSRFSRRFRDLPPPGVPSRVD